MASLRSLLSFSKQHVDFERDTQSVRLLAYPEEDFQGSLNVVIEFVSPQFIDSCSTQQSIVNII